MYRFSVTSKVKTRNTREDAAVSPRIDDLCSFSFLFSIDFFIYSLIGNSCDIWWIKNDLLFIFWNCRHKILFEVKPLLKRKDKRKPVTKVRL